MTHKWQLLQTQTPKSEDEAINALLANRGIKTRKKTLEFLSPPPPSSYKLSSLGIKPNIIKKAISLIRSHIKRGNNIAIYGDYDVDGICSTAILWEAIYAQYKNVFPHIPHRASEGYGLSQKGIDHCLEKGAKLIIAVDNGIVAHDPVAYCRKKNCDIIIIDHHELGDNLPRASYIVHSKETCAAGLAFLFAQKWGIPLIPNQLQLAAIAVTCDIVPLLGVNRSLVKYGLAELNSSPRVGFQALFSEALISPGSIATHEVGFIIGPRINAMGRLGHAIDSLRLICTRSSEKAQELAQVLGQTNRNRQDLTLEAVNHALATIEQTYVGDLPNILIVNDPTYPEGIIGLIAAKLVEKYHRPAIAISEGKTISKASARSVSGFDITQFLKGLSQHLVAVGGHKMAAGFSVKTSNIETLKQLLIEKSRAQISDSLLERVIKVDYKIIPKLINTSLYSRIQNFQPFGLSNPEPLFLAEKLKVINIRTVGKDAKHLKLKLQLGSNRQIDAIAFGQGNQASQIAPGSTIDALCNLNLNSYNGFSNLELKVRDIKPYAETV